jgi:NTP pyrophosphatase (non-canonical NTP hydrolase)
MQIGLKPGETVQITAIEYPTKNDPISAIRDIVPMEELLAQLAEEASELAQAALKVRRTIVKDNPTPVTRRQAEDALLEEIADVKLCLHVAGFEAVRHKIQVNRTITAKAERWLKRLMERGQ